MMMFVRVMVLAMMIMHCIVVMAMIVIARICKQILGFVLMEVKESEHEEHDQHSEHHGPRDFIHANATEFIDGMRQQMKDGDSYH